MAKTELNPSTMLSPIPAVMVSCGTMDESNIITIAWAGTVCSEPPMLSISVRPSRYSYKMIAEQGRFVVNLVNNDTVEACDFCGVKSGRDMDKFSAAGLTKEVGPKTGVPMIKECPVNLECVVKETLELGSHHMFVAEIVGVHVDERLIDEKGAVDLDKAGLMAYSHGEYYGLGEYLGFFGYSVAGQEALKRRWKR